MPREKRLTLDDPNFPHGTYKGYTWGCRASYPCPGVDDAGNPFTCNNASAAYQRDISARRKAKPAEATDATSTEVEETSDAGNATPAPPEETTSTAAETETTAPEPTAGPAPAPTPRPAPPSTKSQTSATGASRRLRALVTIGYSPVRLAHLTKISVDGIWWLLIDPPEKISDTSHRIIAREFHTHSTMPIEESQKHDLGREAGMARNLATTFDWVGPFAWDDIDQDDEPIKKHHRGRITLDQIPTELRHEIVQIWLAQHEAETASAEAPPAPANESDVPADGTATSAEAHAAELQNVIDQLEGARSELALAEQAGRELATESRRLTASNQEHTAALAEKTTELEELRGINSSLASRIHELEQLLESSAIEFENLQLGRVKLVDELEELRKDAGQLGYRVDPETSDREVSFSTGGATDARSVTITIHVGA